MIQYFHIAALALGVFITCIWSKKDLLNFAFKMTFAAFTVWAGLIVAREMVL